MNVTFSESCVNVGNDAGKKENQISKSSLKECIHFLPTTENARHTYPCPPSSLLHQLIEVFYRIFVGHGLQH